MDLFIENPGFCHIGENILKCLDFKTLLSCCLVKKSWKNCHENVVSKMHCDWDHLKNVIFAKLEKNIDPIDYKKDHWKIFISEIMKIPNPLIFLYLLQFFKNEKIDFQNFSPLQAFMKVENLRMIEFILNMFKMHDLFIGLENATEIAIENGQINVLRLFKQHHQISFSIVKVQKYIFQITKNGQLETLKFLLEDLKTKNDFSFWANRWKISNIAAKHGHLEILEFLSQNMHNPIVTDDLGNSTIHYAASNGHFEIVKFLTHFTFDPNIVNDEGLTPSSVARLRGYTNIEKYLVLSAQKKKLKVLELNLW